LIKEKAHSVLKLNGLSLYIQRYAVIWCFEPSNNEDQQSYQLVQISHKGLYLNSIFTINSV